MQDAEALRRTGEGDIQLGCAARSLRDDALGLHHKHGVEFQTLRFRRCHRTGHAWWADDDVCAFAPGFVPNEFLDSRG